MQHFIQAGRMDVGISRYWVSIVILFIFLCLLALYCFITPQRDPRVVPESYLSPKLLLAHLRFYLFICWVTANWELLLSGPSENADAIHAPSPAPAVRSSGCCAACPSRQWAWGSPFSILLWEGVMRGGLNRVCQASARWGSQLQVGAC